MSGKNWKPVGSTIGGLLPGPAHYGKFNPKRPRAEASNQRFARRIEPPVRGRKGRPGKSRVLTFELYFSAFSAPLREDFVIKSLLHRLVY